MPLKTERGNRVFPISDKARDVVDVLVLFAKKNGCHFKTVRAVSLVIEDGSCNGVILESGDKIMADTVVVCTGGLSYPLTGSSGDGYSFAEQAGHTVTPRRPSLVPLESDDIWCRDVQGLSLRNCAVKVEDTLTGKVVFKDFEKCCLPILGLGADGAQCECAYAGMYPGRYCLLVDLKPLTFEQLDARLVRILRKTKRDFSNSLGALLPRSLCPVVVSLSGIHPRQNAIR